MNRKINGQELSDFEEDKIKVAVNAAWDWYLEKTNPRYAAQLREMKPPEFRSQIEGEWVFGEEYEPTDAQKKIYAFFHEQAPFTEEDYIKILKFKEERQDSIWFNDRWLWTHDIVDAHDEEE